LKRLDERLHTNAPAYRGKELRQAVEDAVIRTIVRHPTAENFPLLVQSLSSKNPLVRGEALSGLRKLSVKPKAEDPAPYRAVLHAAPAQKGPGPRWEAVELLRQWSGRSFGATKTNADKELQDWARWFGQTFPREPPLPNVVRDKEPPSKYRFDELLD